jgi:hypothetical protein
MTEATLQTMRRALARDLEEGGLKVQERILSIYRWDHCTRYGARVVPRSPKLDRVWGMGRTNSLRVKPNETCLVY